MKQMVRSAQQSAASRFHAALVATGLQPEERGVWLGIRSTTQDYGWKIHLSSVQVHAGDLLDAVLPVLERHGHPYKVARDDDTLARLNEGEYGATQVGKFMTIYPDDARAARRLAEDLVSLTAGFVGPRIPTDIYLGGTVYARFGAFNPPIERDRLGYVSPRPAHADGEYRVPYRDPEGMSHPFDGLVQETPPPAPGPIGPGFLLLRPIYVHAKGSVILALDVRRAHETGPVVLKEGRRYCMSDAHGRHMRDRLIHQSRVHNELQGKVPLPRAEEVFEFMGNDYLPLEYIEGRDLERRSPQPFSSLPVADRKKLLDALSRLACALRDLHAAGYIHRDLSPRNVRVKPDGDVVLLDLEMSHRFDNPDPPFERGTPGFMSPQQLLSDPPSPADDVYAYGAVMAYCLTGFDPRRLFHEERNREAHALARLTGADEEICRLVADCLSFEAADRPASVDVASRMARLAGRVHAQEEPIDEDHQAIVHEAIRWITAVAPMDGGGRWLSPPIEKSAHRGGGRSEHRLYRSASRGVAGVVYALSRLRRWGFTNDEVDHQVNQAVDWLLSHEPTSDDQLPGLHFGESGVALAIVEAVCAGLIKEGPWLEPYLRQALHGPIDWPDLTHGAAGQGVAALYAAQAIPRLGLQGAAARCADHLVAQQRPDGAWALPEGVRGLEGTMYTGFAHGTAGIVYFMARYARRTGDEKARDAALAGGRWLVENASLEDGARSWSVSPDDESRWNWWCHGGPGISLGLLAVFELTEDETWAAAARDALRAPALMLRHGNLSQCHGLAGLGECYLEAYRVLGETEWLARARQIARTIVLLARRAGGSASWLVESSQSATADLMVGTSGVALFLARVLDPSAGPPLLLEEDP